MVSSQGCCLSNQFSCQDRGPAELGAPSSSNAEIMRGKRSKAENTLNKKYGIFHTWEGSLSGVFTSYVMAVHNAKVEKGGRKMRLSEAMIEMLRIGSIRHRPV